jgi:hypothetical protein
MSGPHRHWTRSVLATAALGVALAAGISSAKTQHVKLTLTPTSKAPTAKGKAALTIKQAKGKLALTARRLTPNKTFDVVIGGIKVGQFTSTGGGAGRLTLSTSPHGRQGTLGSDPEGEEVVVREDDDGDDDLVGDMPHGDSAEGACCLTDHEGEAECEDLSAADCSAHGGTPAGTDSCIPDPCGSGEHENVVCCITHSEDGGFVDEDPETECEETTAAECAHHGGTAMTATSCEPDPCSATPPPAHVACCVPDDGGSETECESITPESCTAHGGTDSGAASCDAHPCGADDDGGGDDGGH